MNPELEKVKYISLRTAIASMVLCPLLLFIAPSKEKIEVREMKQYLVREVYRIAQRGDNNLSFEEKKTLLEKLQVNLPLDKEDRVVLSVESDNTYKMNIGPLLGFSKSQKIEDKTIYDYIKANKNRIDYNSDLNSLCKNPSHTLVSATQKI